MNISELDRKILFELDRDGRASFSKIARIIGSTPQVVKYHYERMIENGVIDKFWAFIDYDKAGYSFFWGYWLKFNGLTKEKEEEMYADFRGNTYIPIIMRSDGYADVMLGIISRDVFHHNKILQGVFEKYGEHITMSDIVVGLGFIKFPRTYLVVKENVFESFSSSGGTKEPVKLSEIDRKMLSLLQIDGRMEFTKMARTLGVSVGQIHKHYLKLTRSGVITKVAYTLNYQVADLALYRILFRIVQFDKKRVDDLYTFCSLHPHIVSYVKVMGNWQLMLDIEIENREKLRDLIREMKNQFKDIIHRVEINEIYKIDKFTQMAIEFPDLLNIEV